MEPEFWLEKWKKMEIGFHRSEVHPLLEKFISILLPSKQNRIFLPLCGKTLDIAWLLSRGYSVVGAELSKEAVSQLFQELGITPTIKPVGKLTHFQANRLDVFVGDVFDLSAKELGKVDGIYDRAALVALPEKMRNSYTSHLRLITQTAPQLLITFVYDQNLMSGPPFSISQAEVTRHYGAFYDLHLLETVNLPGGLKGKCDALEMVYHLQKK